MVNNYIHIGIGVTDLSKAKEFYGGIFDWHIYEEPEMPDYLIYEIKNGDDFVGGGFRLVDEVPSSGTTELYVNTQDIDQKLEEIKKQGGKIVLEKSTLPGGHGFVARFEDPFGNIMGLWSPPQNGSESDD